MQDLWADWLKRVRDVPDSALEWGREGFSFLKSTLGDLPFFASTSVDEAPENPERDETHYLLVPDPFSEGGFSLAERRRLPEGVGTVNSLPKVRIFHVHDEAAVEVLEGMLLGRLTEGAVEEGAEHDLAGRLELMGEEIDRKTHWVTGGLILVGGVVAVANPVVGLGIAAKSLLPEVGAKLTKFGLGAAADSIRSLGTSWRKGAARKEAQSEIEQMEPLLVKDPVLKFLDEMVALGEEADPVVAELAQLPEWWRDRDQRFTMGVVAEVLDDQVWSGWGGTVRKRMAAL